MEIEVIALNAFDEGFDAEFTKYKDKFFAILENSYRTYYGYDYQMKRIKQDQATIYLASVNKLLVGVSYIKKNLRRGGTAVFPEQFRRKGIAERLVKESLISYPKQYTIFRANNFPMRTLMENLGFKNVKSPQEVENLFPHEFSLLSNFSVVEDLIIFSRYSKKRKLMRENLTLFHTFY